MPIASTVQEVHLQPGELLYAEGDPNDCAYFIEKGVVVLYRHMDGHRIEIETRRAGSIIGELSILTGNPRAVSVEALTNVRVYRLPAEQILSRFRGLDPVLKACIETSIDFNATYSEVSKDPSIGAREARTTIEDPSALLTLLKMENDLVKGVFDDEFYLQFQPIVDIHTGQIAGCEALLRWNHPDLGQIPPDTFVTAAEEMGSVSVLTDFALAQASDTLARFLAADPALGDIYFSVNISGIDLDRPEFVDYLCHVLDRNQLERRHLRLEITETALVPCSDVSKANLERLQQMGFGISVDDFGAGYSNLGYLKMLPLTTLKIDRSLAADAATNEVSQSILRMLIALGRELGVDIVAEGLETPQDVATLRNLGCLYAQGYHFFRPMPEVELLPLLMGGACATLVVA